MRNQEANIFNKIKQLNGFETIFPIKIKKTKLNEDIKEQIFKDFKFKYIGKTSTSQKILKDVYNTYFKKVIISTDQDNNKNITFIIKNLFELNQMYVFGMDFLKCFENEGCFFEAETDIDNQILDL